MDQTPGDHRRGGRQRLRSRASWSGSCGCTARRSSRPGSSRRSCKERAKARITSTARLAELVKDAIPAAARRTGGNPAKRTFQALRIEVNGELAALESAVPAALDALAPKGRLVVMSYQSLEDRIVKRALTARARSTGPIDLPVELPGTGPTLRLLTRGSEPPSEAEVAANPRAASVKLRAVERIDQAGPAAPRGRPRTAPDALQRTGDKGGYARGNSRRGRGHERATLTRAPRSGGADRGAGRPDRRRSGGARRRPAGRRRGPAARTGRRRATAGHGAALKLGHRGAAEPTEPVRRRTAPRLRVAPPAPISAPRAPFVALVIALVIAGVLGILLINTKTNENSFQISTLQEAAGRAGQPAAGAGERRSPTYESAGQPGRGRPPAGPGRGRHAGLHPAARRQGHRRAEAGHRRAGGHRAGQGHGAADTPADADGRPTRARPATGR